MTAIWLALWLPIAQTPYRTGIDVVSVSVAVVDRAGRSVPGLTRGDFEVREDGAPQAVSYFSAGDEDAALPLHIGLLFDTSESMERDLSFARSAAIKFLRAFPKADDFTLVEFSTDVRAARFSQAEFPRLVERIRTRAAKGETSLYDAIGVYLTNAFDQTGRKVLVVYTDGGDTTSTRTWSETLRVLRASDVTVYPIGFLTNQPSSVRLEQRLRLSEIASTTGGVAFFPDTMKSLDDMYARISDDIHGQYTLGYISTNPLKNGAWRKLSVRITKPDSRFVVRAREGYFAAAH